MPVVFNTTPNTTQNTTPNTTRDTTKQECKNDNNDKNIIKGRFTPPTVDDVKAYCEERKNNIDAQTFVDFYTSKGWKIGKNSMKDWKATVRTWEQRHKSDIPRTTVPKSMQDAAVNQFWN